MSRARASALALVNWKGVFYERYRLDRHVTALEGANGAGKTTVMIAAYVVLLPDLARLRFTNVGEHGATGGDKGIWGRLGEPSRPAYSVIEFELPSGERVMAGAHLERKAEPSLALTPFLVTGLAESVGLRDVLLVTDGEHEAVPELAEVKDAVKKRGGRITVFSSSKEYFSTLFDLGVTPLRLGTDEERNKLNEMLRTSMTGGISRALTTELRSFLFKQESGLSETLSRMRQNLDACHRTRLEVAEARRVEHEVTGIFEAGREMFGAALAATRRSVEEAERAAEAARSARAAPTAEREAVAQELVELRARSATLEERLAAARAAQGRARENHERAVRALSLVERLAALEAERTRAREAWEAETRVADAAREERAARRAARDRARRAHDRAAHGLGHLQAGLDELHRNAHAYRHATEQLAVAREALAEATLSADAAEARLREVQERIRELDAERARLDRDAELAEARRAERERAVAALAALSGDTSSGASREASSQVSVGAQPHASGEASPSNEYERARAILARHRRLEAIAARLPEL
ncbi:MAG: ATP-binding protein, partial [Pseudomonadota bacterium]